MKKEVSCKRVRKWERRREKEGVRVKKGKEGERKRNLANLTFGCVLSEMEKRRKEGTPLVAFMVELG
jgi:hypothetical protein